MKVLDLTVEHRFPDIPLYHRPVAVEHCEGAGALIVIPVSGEERSDGWV
jgi:hypothetical protein